MINFDPGNFDSGNSMDYVRFLSYMMASLILMLSGCGDSRETYDHDRAVRRVLRVQELQNLNPGDPAVVPEMIAIVDSMSRAGRDACYFAAANVLVDRLFADGRYAEADSFAVRMQQEASAGGDSLATAMAKRVRAQILYKLSQPERALDELKSALPYIDRPINTGPEFGTATSIEEWIHIIARASRDTSMMNEAAGRFAALTRGGIASTDTTGHYPVTALAFEAEAALTHGDAATARILLDSAAVFIRPELPARAYEHFYYSRGRLRMCDSDYAGALADADTLLSTHSNYPWFYLHDLLLKADILEAAGMHDRSAATYSRYVEYHDSISRRFTDRRLHDLTVLYRTEIDREQRRIHIMRLTALGATSLLLLILLGVTLRHVMAEKKRNRLLVERLREYDRTGRSLRDSVMKKESPDEPPLARLDRYMLEEHPYTDPALGRKELADFLSVSPDELARMIRGERGSSVHGYINSFRTDEARRILDAEPDATIADIASRLGFGTARTLQRAFRERFDMTPSQYRAASDSLRNPSI